jgi:flagellar biogenesis protein FliO
MDVGALRQVLSVLLVFSLLGLVLWKLRRPGSGFRSPWRRPGGNARSLEAVERLALTPQHALHLVRVQGREVVVATHPQGCTVLRETAGRASAAFLNRDREGAGA